MNPATLAAVIGKPNKFSPFSLPGMVGYWPLNEGSGRAYNKAPGSRTVAKNLLPVPEDFTAAAWTKTSVTATDAVALNPDGTQTTAARLVWTAASSGFVQCATQVPVLGAPAGQYTFSLWVKSNTGSPQTVRLAGNTSANVSADLPVTTSWTRISFTWTDASPVTNVLIRQDAAGNATDILAWGAQLESGASATAYEPPQYDLYPSTAAAWGALGFTTTTGSTFAYAGSPGGGLSLPAFSVYGIFKQTALNASYAALLAAASYTNLSLQGSSTSQKPLLFYNGSQGPTASGGSQYQKFTRTDDAAWHVLAVTYDGTDFRYYIDGLEYQYGTAVRAAPSIPYLLLGSPGVGLIGTIGPQALYSQVHTIDQVRAITSFFQADRQSRGEVVNGTTEWVWFSGDSLTGNTGSWSETVATNLFQAGRQFRNDGVGGSQVTLGTLPADGSRLTALLRSAPATLRRRIAVVAFGTNDYTTMDGPTFYANLKAYCQGLTAAGWLVVVCTTPSGGGTGSNINTRRAVGNPLIVANAVNEKWAVAVADFAADAIMGLDSTSDATPNAYMGDPLHPNAGGNARLAPIAQTAVSTALSL